jgi:hypothetical protein
MDTSLNRDEILKMVEAGELSALEAAEKLAALRNPPPAPPAPRAPRAPVPPLSAENKKRMLHVSVTDLDSGRAKVRVNLPMSWVHLGLSMGARFAPELEDLDLQTLLDALKDETAGKIVEVEDVEDGERVEIYID